MGVRFGAIGLNYGILESIGMLVNAKIYFVASMDSASNYKLFSYI